MQEKFQLVIIFEGVKEDFSFANGRELDILTESGTFQLTENRAFSSVYRNIAPLADETRGLVCVLDGEGNFIKQYISEEAGAFRDADDYAVRIAAKKHAQQ